jgi:hypothetical protein
MSRYAVANGNWSNPATWDGGTLPASTAIVRPNGFTVTIDQTITVNELRNDASTPAVAGGSFVLTGNHTINISVSIQCFASTLLVYNGTGNAFITGTNAGASIISSTTTNTTSTITHSGTGHLTVDMVINSVIVGEANRFNIGVTGGGTLTCLKAVQKGGNLVAINAVGTGAINVTTTPNATINTPDITGVGGNGYTINSSVLTTINVNGNITGRLLDAAGTPNGGAILLQGTNSVLNITGNVSSSGLTGGGGNHRVVFLNAAGIINMTGTVGAMTGSVTSVSAVISLANSSSVLNLIGNVIGGSVGAGSISSAGAINITGSVTGGSTGSSSAINSSGICTITGNVTGSSIASSTNVFISAGTCNITGTITGGAGNGAAGVTCSGGTLNHIGTVQASSTAPGITGGLPQTSTVNCTGPFLRNGYIVAFAGQTLRINSAYNPYFEFRKSDGTNVVYVDQSTLNFPAITNVRSGTTYASGLYTGTLNVPLPSQVLAGIPIDATTGTLLMSPADFWNYLISSGFVSGSIGERLQNASTVATTGSQIASYTI